MVVTVGKDQYDGTFEQCLGGLRRYKMADQEKIDRRIAVVGRRSGEMVRRQFIDIGWPIEKERRVAPEDRRQGREDRRGE